MATMAAIWHGTPPTTRSAKSVVERKGGVGKGEKRLMRTTKGGPHGQVQRARNFISESGRPCIFHAARKRHDAIPIDNHAIYSTMHGHAARHGARAKGGKTTTRASATLHMQST